MGLVRLDLVFKRPDLFILRPDYFLLLLNFSFHTADYFFLVFKGQSLLIHIKSRLCLVSVL